MTAAPQICEGCDESRSTSLHLITRHNGTTARAHYCVDCAELARMDWNGETTSIAPALTADTITDDEIRALRRAEPRLLDTLMIAIHGTDPELRRCARATFAELANTKEG